MNAQTSSPTVFDVQRIRADFPLLSRTVHDKPLVYFDNANTSQKPRTVIEAVDAHYRRHNANVSRAVHQLGEEATAAYEGARDKLARFINAGTREQLILTSGTTQATNLVAYSYVMPRLQPGDADRSTVMEHHANIVPWQLVAQRRGATVKAAPINERGELLVEQYIAMLTPEVKLACVTHVSNVLGTVNPVREIARECRKRGIALLVDGSHAVPHRPVDVQALGCDFYAFTGHKMLAPTGTGALWARREHLRGDAAVLRRRRDDPRSPLRRHHLRRAAAQVRGRYAEHRRFRGHGGGHRLHRIGGLCRDPDVGEQQLLQYATERLHEVPGLRIIGEAAGKEPVISFLVDGAQATDLATLLDLEGIAVRSGHHCAHPLMQFYGVPATLRASLAFYNTREEIDSFLDALLKVRRMLR
ncbi:Cysteine desulfurase OS=Rhodanobacter lindaniclasticus OX=75310 GN=B1991_03600 PE=3 SV=1 [Rhodanobacter lindaniclasticus]